MTQTLMHPPGYAMAILDNPDNVMGVSHEDNHLQLSSLLPQSKVQRLCPYMVITVMPTPLLLCPPSASVLRRPFPPPVFGRLQYAIWRGKAWDICHCVRWRQADRWCAHLGQFEWLGFEICTSTNLCTITVDSSGCEISWKLMKSHASLMLEWVPHGVVL